MKTLGSFSGIDSSHNPFNVGYFVLRGKSFQVSSGVLAFAAASFIYVAMADLIPGLHKRIDLNTTVQQFSLIMIGVSVIYFMHDVLG